MFFLCLSASQGRVASTLLFRLEPIANETPLCFWVSRHSG